MANRKPPPSAGFTMIEALVALAIVAVALAAIGSLAAFNIRGTARLERQVILQGVMRSVLATISMQRSGSDFQAGEIDGFRWEARSLAPPRQQAVQAPWSPRIVTVTVRAPGGREFQIKTVRLRPTINGRG